MTEAESVTLVTTEYDDNIGEIGFTEIFSAHVLFRRHGY